MAKVGLFFGSDGGNTKDIAEKIAESLGDVDLFDVSDASVDEFGNYSSIILGTSTWGDGDLQSDWEDFIDELDEVDLNGKTVAVFGLGDQEGYADTFCNAMRAVHDKAVERGAKIVGSWANEGYEFEESESVVDGKFVGLALDEDNQDDLTDERIEAWTSQIK
ncbi:uncharacterized protein LOC111320409, partial [Stylophora pistillata]|uniref:uncharacterized protein LOC111320409 n=1 Tax=Stylophora pistillata TaxID=50429 RepID=UPI000C04766D